MSTEIKDVVDAQAAPVPETQVLSIDLTSNSFYDRKKSPLRKDPRKSLAEQLLGDDYIALLSPGTADYQHRYQQRVAAFKANLPIADRSKLNRLSNDPDRRTFFREAYQQLLRDIQSGKRPAAKNTTDPNKATSVEKLLGKDGLILCRLATEEELHDLRYRMAVIEQSVEGYSGEKWSRLPSITLAGPSGSGKSVAVKALIQKLTGSERINNNSADNLVIVVDGQNGRAEDVANPNGSSSVLTSTIQMAKANGFNYGVADLHEHTKNYTESAKQLARKVAFIATDRGSAGHIMPETLTDYLVSSHIRDAVKRLISLGSRPNVQSIFVNIHANADAVRQQAEKRAAEQSKAYNTNGFRFSEFCTAIVKKAFMANGRANTTYVKYTNDRILVKPIEVNGQRTWITAKYGDKDTIVVSQRALEQWLALKEKNQDLPDYAKEQQPKALLHFENGLARAHQRLKHCIAVLKNQQANLDSKSTPEAFVRIHAKINYMKRVIRNSPIGLPDAKAQAAMTQIVKEGQSITIKGDKVHPQYLFSAREREAISGVIDCLAIQSKNQTQQISLSAPSASVSRSLDEQAARLSADMPNITHTRSSLFAAPAPKNTVNLTYEAIRKLEDYIILREQQDKMVLLSKLYNAFGYSAHEKIDVAKRLIKHLQNQLNHGSSILTLASRQQAAAQQGRIGEIVSFLKVNHLLDTASRPATTDDLPDSNTSPLPIQQLPPRPRSASF